MTATVQEREVCAGQGKPANGKRAIKPGVSARGHTSWLTTDADEIERRRQRAASEPMAFRRLGDGKSIFANYEIWRTDPVDARHYTVELRSLDRLANSCDCRDYQKNRLGTCKHIERISAAVADGDESESPLVEVFLEHQADGGVVPRVIVPLRCSPAAREFMSRYLGVADRLKRPVATTLAVMLRNLRYAPAAVKRRIRVSSVVRTYVDQCLHDEKMAKLRETCAGQLRKDAGKAVFLHHPLYDYQIDGMLHLAFSGRALLTDEMGLGKTVQAIAAARVLHDLYDIRRTLVVSPASLKAEWEDQIHKFTDLSCEVVLGGRQERLHRYRESDAFFILTNYEQIIRDWREINHVLQPDLVILDEAQRIKNWKTKTARHIKDLDSRFAFVLTGTPLENRIDELYSLVEFVDPTLFGSLFQFNRRFYNFDEEGKTAGFKNLSELHKTVGKVMLRRRKDQIQEQLPERIDNNYFVSMTNEQSLRYEDHAVPAARLMSAAKRRPLTPPEHDSLQRHLSCMRMLCDSVYILDQDIRDSPKVDELQNILADLWETDPQRKVIVFSEWVRMLELVRERLDTDGVGYALHTGGVPQKKRREEINRFKQAAECRVFLSTDSGGVGLNLQSASVVVNLDLPWNPAKLEQRIARAWRKHQKNAVNVVNLVAEGTIEHRMLGTLSFKQGLADAVLDGRGDIGEIEKPASRSQFMERLASIMSTDFTPPPADAEQTGDREIPVDVTRGSVLDRLSEDLSVTAPPNLDYCAAIDDGAGSPKAIFAVAVDAAKAKSELGEALGRAGGGAPEVMVVDSATRDLLAKLAEAGVITIHADTLRPLVDRAPAADRDAARHRQWRKQIDALLADGRRKLDMAAVLAGSGFAEEALPPIMQAGRLAGRALCAVSAPQVMQAPPEELDAQAVDAICQLSGMNVATALFLHACLGATPHVPPEQLLKSAQTTIDDAQQRLLAVSRS